MNIFNDIYNAANNYRESIWNKKGYQIAKKYKDGTWKSVDIRGTWKNKPYTYETKHEAENALKRLEHDHPESKFLLSNDNGEFID